MLVLALERNGCAMVDLREFGLGVAKVTFIEPRNRGRQVRIGFEFDARVPVHREKIFNAIERNRQSAAQTSNPLGSQEGSKPAGGSGKEGEAAA